MEYDQSPRYPAPPASRTLYEPARLFRNVAGVNDQVLRKVEIRPNHHERQHQFTEIVKMTPSKYAVHRDLVVQERENDNRKADAAQRPARYEQQAPDGREPVR